jgi:hypothetical protein
LGTSGSWLATGTNLALRADGGPCSTAFLAAIAVFSLALFASASLVCMSPVAGPAMSMTLKLPSLALTTPFSLEGTGPRTRPSWTFIEES